MKEKTLVMIPNYGRDEIHDNWKKVLEKCNKREEKGFEYYVHQDSSPEKKLIFIDGNRNKGVELIGEAIGRYAGDTDIIHILRSLERGINEVIEYKDFLNSLKGPVLIMNGATYLEDEWVEAYHSLLEKAFTEDTEEKEEVEKYMKQWCPKTWEKLGLNVELYKFPMSQEGIKYKSYTNGGDNSLLPAVRRLEESFNEGFHAIEEYAKEGNYEEWANKWS